MITNRLDVELFEREFCKSRERAKQLIKNGHITVNGVLCKKPSQLVELDAEIQISGDIHKYVGRGGLKLEKALDFFSNSLKGFTCLDIGASTGGFTDCMLQNGASKVYALDVGHSQLDESLINDTRVVNMEKRNIRDMKPEDFDDKLDFIATDVSFISLKLVIPKIKELLCSAGTSVVLIKPQFEVGKENINKTGLVKNPKLHRQVLSDITSFSENAGLSVLGLCASPITGGSGNSEYLMYLGKDTVGLKTLTYDIDKLVNEVFMEERRK